jgi:hypothetical protein
MDKLEQFLTGDSEEPPAELLVTSETKPNHEPCPFFVKTGCCRFGNQCSRNHQFPGISRVRLIILISGKFCVHLQIMTKIHTIFMRLNNEFITVYEGNI